MSMITETLTVGTWHELTDLDDAGLAQFYLDSADLVIAALEAAEPDSASVGYSCTEGINTFSIPLGKQCWLKLTTGACDVTYSQFDGVLVDLDNCAYAKSDGVSVDDLVTGEPPIVGYDDSPADQLSYVGLLHTEAVGVASAATIDSASMTLLFSRVKVGRVIRVYGVESATSVTSGLTDYASLASGLTLTTAFEDVTLDGNGVARFDLTAIMQELVDDVGAWTTASPLQLWIGDNGSAPTSGNDETATTFVSGKSSALFVRAS